MQQTDGRSARGWLIWVAAGLVTAGLVVVLIVAIGIRTAEHGRKVPVPDAQTSSLKGRARHSSLKAAVGNRFQMGVGVSHTVADDADDVRLITKHFQFLTPENCMKLEAIQPSEDEFRFDEADKFVDFARANGLETIGHCLVWAKDERTPAWMMTDDGRPVSGARLIERIQAHIDRVVDRYAGVVQQWDVVNEALSDSEGELLRNSVYSRTTGDDFVVAAFQAAREKAPHALLIYNDYNCEMPEKRKKLLALLQSLKAKGAPVDAVGMQGHFELGDKSLEQLRETFDELRRINMKVVISELDLDVIPRARWWAENGKYREELAHHDPYRNGCPNAILERQAAQYAELFKLFVRYSDILVRVSFWNLHDGQSWLNGFPWTRVNYPLLFDRHREPKPAFGAVIGALEQGQGS